MSSTMPDYTGWIVRAQAGRDKGGLFCVMGIVQEGRRLLLADGKRRRANDNALRQYFKRMLKSGDLARFDMGIVLLSICSIKANDTLPKWEKNMQ